MPEPQPDHLTEADLEAARELTDDLAALFARPVPVPREVDEAILTMGRRRLGRPRKRWRVVPWAAAAAAAVLLVALTLPTLQRAAQAPKAAPRPSTAAVRLSREDINGDGQVDILDAFLLARRIQAAEPLRAEWDIDGDGAVNDHDVHRVAKAAVRLDRGAL